MDCLRLLFPLGGLDNLSSKRDIGASDRTESHFRVSPGSLSRPIYPWAQPVPGQGGTEKVFTRGQRSVFLTCLKKHDPWWRGVGNSGQAPAQKPPSFHPISEIQLAHQLKAGDSQKK